MSMSQAGLNLKVEAPRTVFSTVEYVRSLKRVDAESVFAMVDSAELKWVFNIGLGERRELRFMTAELVAPELAPRTLTTAINSILGAGATITRGILERDWVCHHTHIMRLIREREISLLTPSKVSRTSLVAFLQSRWVGTIAIKQKGVTV